MNAGDAVFQFPGCSPGAQVSTGRILTVRTPPGKADLLFFSVHDRGALDKDPCVRCQAIPDIPFFGAVRHLDSGPDTFWERVFPVQEIWMHSLPDTHQHTPRTPRICGCPSGLPVPRCRPPYRGRKPKPGSPDGSGRGKSRLQK